MKNVTKSTVNGDVPVTRWPSRNFFNVEDCPSWLPSAVSVTLRTTHGPYPQAVIRQLNFSISEWTVRRYFKKEKASLHFLKETDECFVFSMCVSVLLSARHRLDTV